MNTTSEVFWKLFKDTGSVAAYLIYRTFSKFSKN